MKTLKIIGIIALVLVTLVGGCAIFGWSQANRLRPSVRAFVDEFDAQFNSGSHRYIYDSMVGSEFKSVVDPAVSEQLLVRISEKLGKVIQRQEEGWRIRYQGASIYFSVRYKTTRERGVAWEDFVLKKDGASWKLVGYNVNSLDLL